MSELMRTASRWLARLDRGNMSAAEQAAFEAWKASASDHDAAFRELDAVWRRLDRLQDLGIENEAIDQNALDPDALHAGASAPVRARLRTRWLVGALAAAAALLVFFLWLRQNADQPPTSAQVTTSRHATPIGGHEQIVLSEGSVIELNTDTALTATLSDRERRLALERGEASFEVTPDPHRPFMVSAGRLEIRAVGTAFNVECRGACAADESHIEVIVIQGKVAIGGPKGEATLVAGDVALAGPAGLELGQLTAESLKRKLAWKNGMLAFEDVTLTEAAREFNRYNTRRLVIADPSIRSFRIGGYFRANNVEGFVRLLEEHFAIRAIREPTEIRLSRAQNPKTR